MPSHFETMIDFISWVYANPCLYELGENEISSRISDAYESSFDAPLRSVLPGNR